MSKADALEMKCKLESNGGAEFQVYTLNKTVTITNKMVLINKKKEHQRIFTPSVIEPSFGISRIIYCLYEHCFYTRAGKTEDEKLNVFGFSPLVAPYKCSVLPLVKNEQFDVVAADIAEELADAGIDNLIDVTGTSIGKRYAKVDELGVPLAVTVDSTTTVTIRERDSKAPVRVKIADVKSIVKRFVKVKITWGDIQSEYPAAHGSPDKDENATEE